MAVNYPSIPEGPLAPGDCAPWFQLPADNRPDFQFSTVAGTRSVLFFFGTAREPACAAALASLSEAAGILSRMGVGLIGVSIDPEDQRRMTGQPPPGLRILFDPDKNVSRAYGLIGAGDGYLPRAFLLDEKLRVRAILPLQDPAAFVEAVVAAIHQLPPPAPLHPAAGQAPVLLVDTVLEPELCGRLIDHYESLGGTPSGFVEERDGITRGVLNSSFKRRRDILLQQPELLGAINRRITRRVAPEVYKAFQFKMTRVERYLIACYDAADLGRFRAHRDNTTRGTAHRRFAMTLNLNEGAYEGGQLRFPEYGNALFRPRTGEAVLFSCSLQHEAMPVTAGRRYALLSFYYDDAAAEIRADNLRYVEGAQTVS